MIWFFYYINLRNQITVSNINYLNPRKISSSIGIRTASYVKTAIINDTLAKRSIKCNQSSKPWLEMKNNSNILFPNSVSSHKTIQKYSSSPSKYRWINLSLKGYLVNMNTLHKEVDISCVMNPIEMKLG